MAGATLGAGAAWAADIQISHYESDPDPVGANGQAAFELRLSNNSVGEVISDAVLTINVAPNFTVGPADVPGYCVLAGAPGSQTITCNIPSLPPGDTYVEYTGTATQVGAFPSSATLSSASANDPNTGNNTLPLTPNVVAGADLTITKDDNEADNTIAAGETLTYTLTAHNAGPHATNSVRIVDDLPVSSDFQFGSASGANWTCNHSAGRVTCDYAGPPVLNASYPPVNIVGTVVKAITGTITNNAEVQLTDALMAEPNDDNNTTGPVTTQISPGADLVADKTMPSTIVEGATVNVTLRINNQGPFAVTGATMTDTFHDNFTLGTMPTGCSAVGQTVTCTSGTITNGGNQQWVIPVTGTTPTGGSFINTATVAPPASVADPNPANNQDHANFQISSPSADLTISKSKTPNPVDEGDLVTSNITVRNLGPAVLTYTPATPIIVRDTVTSQANESLTSNSSGWDCNQVGAVITCQTTGSGTLPVNGTIGLQITATVGAGIDGPLGNTACTGSTAGSLATPLDENTGNDCQGAGVYATPDEADLSVTKHVSLTPGGGWVTSGLTVGAAAQEFYIRLTATHNAGDQADNVIVTDDVPNALNLSGSPGIPAAVTTFAEVSKSAGTITFDTQTGLITWALEDMTAGTTHEAIIRVNRPMGSGEFENEAIITSPDTTETTLGNNRATATYTVDPVADITVTQKATSPNPARVGVLGNYTISVRNNGPNPADGVELIDVIDPSRFELVGNPTTAKNGASCTNDTSSGTVTCDLGLFARGETHQVVQQIRPRYPFGGETTDFPVSHTNTAEVSTDTVQVAGHAPDELDLIHNVNIPAYDLQISKQEPDATFDPVQYGAELVYLVRVSNVGPSRATNVVVTDIPAPPSGYTMVYQGASVNSVPPTSGFVHRSTAGSGCQETSGNVVCRVHMSDGPQNYLDAGQQIIFRIRFLPGGVAPENSLTFTNNVNVTASEQPTTTSVLADSNLVNNSASQTTTVLPATDLEVFSKTLLSAQPAEINQALEYDIVIQNNGPSPTPQVRLTDALPTGFVLATPAPVATPNVGSNAVVNSMDCSGTTTVLCVLRGQFPGDGSKVTVKLFVRAVYPFTGSTATPHENTATIAPGRDDGGNVISRDTNDANNSKAATVQLQQSSIAGSVYNDANRDGVMQAGEALSGVTVTLTGVDDFGATLDPRFTTTNASGAFSFDRLPAGAYVLTETQPADYFDWTETAGSAGGTVSATFSNDAADNAITAIDLNPNTTATGYVFREVRESSLSGYIYRDLDNDGAREGGEAGYAPAAFASTPQVRLTGDNYGGVAVNLTATVDANGQYVFNDLPPSDDDGYTVTELVQPNDAADGLDANGAGVIVPDSNNRTAPEDIVVGVVAPAAALTERNFGELPTATLSGFVFFDINLNATRDAPDTAGVSGATLRLTGTDDRGTAVDCTVTSLGSGAYSFPNTSDPVTACRVLRAGTYQVEVTPPAGLDHVGAYIGSAGGTSGGVSGANSPSPGAANTTITNVVLTFGQAATNYNFAESGEALTGYVYLDGNDNGVRDAGEQGVPGVTITLSGHAAGGANVCTLLASCQRVTDASGAFTYLNLPPADGAGYTLTEQSQSAAPLSQYGDGQDAAGTVAGSPIGVAGNDVISGIQVGTGQIGVDYRFGERPGSITGAVFIDEDDDGLRDPVDGGLSNVVITLSGTTALGADICAERAALPTPLTCTTTTANDGTFSFRELPAGDYALVETHPPGLLDRKETAGTAGGTVNTTIFDATPAANQIGGIVLGAGVNATNYYFAEMHPPAPQPSGVTIAGRVFRDPQRDGLDNNEPGIPGVSVRLVQTGVVVRTVTTGPDGGFEFTNVPPGAYTVEEDQPPGYGSSTPNAFPVVAAAGTPVFVRFGETTSTLSGAVYVDANNDNARQAGEAGIAGVTVRLTGVASNGQAVDATRTTDANGGFVFDELLTGQYTLTETQPTNYEDRGEAAGSAGGTVANDVISGISMPVDTDATGYLFAEFGAGLQGSVYVDVDDDGVRDSNEPGIEGVTIRLLDPSGTVVRTTQTDATGAYSFPGIPFAAYVVEEVQPEGYGDGRENTSPRVPVTVGAQPPAPINFGEKTGSISGLVYVDENGDGQRAASEPAIMGVTVTLTGVDARGRNVTATAVTASDGSYRFSGLPGGQYVITETQPANYDDGVETVGSAGGAPSAPDAITGVALAPAQDATGYLFGERVQVRSQLSGSIWLDLDHDRVRDPNEPPKADWTVELRLGEVLVASTKTSANGDYQFSNLTPGSGYRLRFRDPEGNTWGGARSNEDGSTPPDGEITPDNPGGARFVNGELVDIKLLPGANVTEQSLPLDPAGVVYDAVRRTPVAGAVVAFSGPPGFDPALHLLGGVPNVVQTTGADGIYQFLLLQGAPAGVYSLQVTPPAGYNPVMPSALIPPCPGTLTVGGFPSPMLVSSITGAPPTTALQSCNTGLESTAYFFSFGLTVGVSADVLNNNIPIDPLLEGALVVTKTTPMVNVSRGGLVPYTITVRNTSAGPLNGVTVTDRTPAGFRYRKDSARIGGIPTEPTENGRQLSWAGLNFAANEEKKIDLILTVGAGVGSGEHVNQAFAADGATGTMLSGIADATVRLGADPDFDCTDVLGKVFDDRNANGVQDEGEPGLGGVRLATTDGLLITTDAEGRYHITCPMVPNESRGSNFILKLDERTLPTGYRMVTGNPETVRLTRGKFAKLNFGASLHRVVRLDVTAAAFSGDDVAEAFRPRVEALVKTLAERPSVLRVAYHAAGEDSDLVKRRTEALREAIEREWRRDRDRYRLVIELEDRVRGVAQ